MFFPKPGFQCGNFGTNIMGIATAEYFLIGAKVGTPPHVGVGGLGGKPGGAAIEHDHAIAVAGPVHELAAGGDDDFFSNTV